MLVAVVYGLTASGLCLAAASIFLLADVIALTPSRAIKHAWRMLTAVIILCVGLGTVRLLASRPKSDAGDLIAACIHVLGPGFVLVIAWLSRATARDLQRLRDLERTALLDPLTELPNRRAFDDRLHAEIEASRRSGGTLSLVLVDIDHFKAVNDTFGHAVGDQVLRKIAVTISGVLKDEGAPSRIGGEEFAIILPSLAASSVRLVTERLRRAVETTFFEGADGRRFGVTASFGAAVLRAGDTWESLFLRADEALYAAKRNGRNRVTLAAA